MLVTGKLTDEYELIDIMDRWEEQGPEVTVHTEHEAIDPVAFGARVGDTFIETPRLAAFAKVPFPVGEGIGGAHQAVVVYAHDHRDAISFQDRQYGYGQAVKEKMYMGDVGSLALNQRFQLAGRLFIIDKSRHVFKLLGKSRFGQFRVIHEVTGIGTGQILAVLQAKGDNRMAMPFQELYGIEKYGFRPSFFIEIFIDLKYLHDWLIV